MRQPALKRDVPHHLIEELSEEELEICKQIELLAFD